MLKWPRYYSIPEYPFWTRDGSRTWGKKCGRLPLEKQIGPRSATKPGRQKIPTIGSAAPGRHRPATVAPLPACPRTAALRLAFYPSLRVSSFIFELQRAHLPAFHSHFLNFFSLNSIFFCLSHCTQYRHCVFQFFSLNHIFFCLSHHGTVPRARFPVPDDDGFKQWRGWYCGGRNSQHGENNSSTTNTIQCPIAKDVFICTRQRTSTCWPY